MVLPDLSPRPGDLDPVETMPREELQCVLTRPQRLDELTIRVESRTPLSDADAAAVGGRVTARAKDTTGAGVTFDVVKPGSVERSAGKMRRIVDER